MIKQLTQRRATKLKDHRYGPGYNFGATYYDAMDEAVRHRRPHDRHRAPGPRPLVDPASPAARAIGHGLEAARDALDALDDEALLTIGIDPSITAPPVADAHPWSTSPDTGGEECPVEASRCSKLSPRQPRQRLVGAASA